MGLKEQVFQYGGGLGGVRHPNQHAQRQEIVNDCLANVENGDVVGGQNVGQGMGNARTVRAVDADEKNLVHGILPRWETIAGNLPGLCYCEMARKFKHLALLRPPVQCVFGGKVLKSMRDIVAARARLKAAESQRAR